MRVQEQPGEGMMPGGREGAGPGQTSAGAVRTGRSLPTAAEIAIAIAMVLAVQAVTGLTQSRIEANDGRGFDGRLYYDIAEQLAAGQPPSNVSRFARRFGTPLLATWADPDDLIRGFQTVNMIATVVSAILLLVWLRSYISSPWIRLICLALYAAHWLQLVRFTFFYPVLVDAWAQAFCLAGLNAITWYERRPGWRPLLAIAVVSAAGVFFRELVLLIPLAFLFARNPRLHHRLSFPYLQGRDLPRPVECIPAIAAAAALIWIDGFVIGTDVDFSAQEHFAHRAVTRNAVSYLLGWLVAFGPALFVVLFDWRSARDFLLRHTALLVYVSGVAAVAWIGSLESERHALNYASPVVYVLLGRTIDRHRAWFASLPFAGVLVAAMAVVSRLFWTTPQPRDEDTAVSSMLLTPLGERVGYLHLFPNYLLPDLAWTQLAQHALLGAVILVWLARRAYVAAARGAARAGAATDAAVDAPPADVRGAPGTPPRGVRGPAPWRWRLANVLLLLGLGMLAGGWAAYRVTRTPVRVIKIRWAEGLPAASRRALEPQLGLRRCAPEDDALGRTHVCELLIWTPEHMTALVLSPAVEDTSGFDRGTLSFPPDAPLGPGYQWRVHAWPWFRRPGAVESVFVGVAGMMVLGIALRHDGTAWETAG